MILFTFADAFDSLIAYMGAAPSAQTLRDCRQSIDGALYDLVNSHNWSYYYSVGRLNLNAPYNTGTIQYWYQDGASPFLCQLTGGTLPTWTANAVLYVNNVVYQVDQYLTPTTFTLLPPLVPVVDLPAGTSYQLYQDTYELPVDFRAQDQSLYESVFGALQYVHPREWLFQHRWLYNSGVPSNYTIMGDPKYANRLVARFAPLPTESRTLDFIYQRRPRPILWQNMSQGTISLTANSTVVTGMGTAFDQTMVGTGQGFGGSVLRVSSNSSVPTWMPGTNPAVFEAQIYSVQSATQLTIMPLTPSTVTYTNTGYMISDPLDVETGSMREAFIRCCEWKLSQIRIMKDAKDRKAIYLDELRRAKEADVRSFSGRAEGEWTWHKQRMKDMPLGPDQPAGID